MIREFKNDDIYELNKLFNKCFDKDNKISNLKPSGTILVLEVDNKIIGMATIDILNDIFNDCKYGYINNVCVDSDYSNHGFGKLIMQEIEKFARDNDCSYITMTSNRKRIFAHKLYLSLGYEIKDTCVFKKKLKD